MSKFVKKADFWLRRRSRLPLIAILTLIVLLLFINEDTSVSRNVEYDQQINELRVKIKECQDSARYYRERRRAIEQGSDDLERMAREQFHMQRATEEVYYLD